MKKSPPRTSVYRQGFTLLEISIVLVVLGLIVGGIFAGTALMKTFELRAFSKEKENYVLVAGLFKTKYGYLPGDFPGATAIWGHSNKCGGADTSVKATCDGDGRHGLFSSISETARDYERLGFWQHLSNAGFLPHQYSGYNSAGHFPGDNIPLSPNHAGAWAAFFWGINWWNIMFSSKHDNTLFFGDFKGWDHVSPVMTPKDLMNIDMKIDDGFPATGAVGSLTGVENPDCTLKANGSSPTEASDLTATYNAIGTNGDKIACTAVFRDVF